MLKKARVSVVLAAFCALAILTCLVGCGPDHTPNFTGTWRVVSMQDASGSDLTAVVEQLASANKELVLTLSDDKDKTASFNLADQTTLQGKWKPTGEDTCVINFEGYAETKATLKDGALSFEENGQYMTLKKKE